MSRPEQLRRAVALVRSGAAGPEWASVGNRPIYQFWHLLSPHFRHVLLPPQRRSDGAGFTWSWRDAGAAGPPTAAELADLRQRLKLAERTFTAASTEPPWQQDSEEADGPRSPGARVKSAAQAMVAQFTSASDAALAGFVCRTENGPMLHSWAASVPAVPVFIDAIECEIGGTVLLGDESGAGLELVLENRAGAIIAQTRTDAAGLFLFRKIPAGDYRIRVDHRGDFPTTGFSVSVEQDSIYGLELRRGAAVATYSRVPSRAPFESRTPVEVFSNVPFPVRRRSPRPLLLALLAVALPGAAGLAWYFFAGAADGRGRAPAAWGQAAGGDAVVARADEVVAAASGSGRVTGGSGVSRTVGGHPGAESAARHAEGGWARNGRVEPAREPVGTDTLRAKDKRRPISALRGAVVATSAEGEVPSESETAGSPEVQSPDRAAPASRRRPAAQPGGSLRNPPPVATTAAAPAAPAEAAAGAVPSIAEATDGPAQPVGDRSIRSAKTAGRGNPAGGKAAGAAEAAAAEGAPAGRVGPSSVDAGAGGFAAGSAASARAGGDRRAGNGPSAPSAGGAGPETGDDGADAGIAADRDTAERRAQTIAAAPRSRAAARAKAAASSGEATTSAEADVAAAAGDASEGGRSPAAAEAAGGSSPQRVERGGVAKGRGGEAVAPVASAESGSGVVRAAGASRRAAAPARGAGPETAEEAGGAVAPVTFLKQETATDESALPQRHRVVLAAGGLRLLRDAILPTQPMPIGRAEPLESLRRRLQEEHEARIPPVFRAAVTRQGVVLDLPASTVQNEMALRWLDATGAVPAGAGIEGTRAELVWDGARAAAGEWRLVRPDGSELARVARQADGIVTVRAIPAVRGSIWVGVEGAAAAHPLEWLTWEGAELPGSWRRSDRWSGGRGARLELPLAPGGANLGPVALVDSRSGWAITFDVGRR